MRRLRAPLRLVVLLVLAAGEALHAATPTTAAFDATPAWPAAFAPRLKSAGPAGTASAWSAVPVFPSSPLKELDSAEGTADFRMTGADPR